MDEDRIDESCLISSYTACDTTPGNNANIALLSETLSVIREIADALANEEKSDDLRAFYRHLHALSFLIADQINSLQGAHLSASVRLVTNTVLDHLAFLITDNRIPADLEPQIPFHQIHSLISLWRSSVSLRARNACVRECLDFARPERRHKLERLLRDCTDTLKEHNYETVEVPDVQVRKLREPPDSVWTAANGVFRALVASTKTCDCYPYHQCAARLKLATHRTPHSPDNQCSFDIFITIKLCEALWQEAQIQASLLRRMSRVRIEAPNDRRKDRRPSARLAINKLCEQIDKIKSKPSWRLSMTLEDDMLWKAQSSRRNLSLKTSDVPLSLEQIIKDHPANLTEKTNRVLAVLLGYTVLHLHGTPWLRHSSFTSSNILFLSTLKYIPLAPFIHTRMDLDSTQVVDGEVLDDTSDAMDPDDIPIHPYPSIVMLAIMLKEVYTARPLESFFEPLEVLWDHLETLGENEHWEIAMDAFTRTKSEFSAKYRTAVAKCLDQDIAFDADDNLRDESDLELYIYEEIVQCLEDELDQSFGSSLPIDKLDEIAPTLDIRGWVQARSSVQAPSPKMENQEFHQRSSDNHPHNTSLLTRSSTMNSNLTSEQEDPCIPSEFQFQRRSRSAILDEEHDRLPQDLADKNSYVLGRIGMHNTVLSCLPAGVIGTISAASVANRMVLSFPVLRFCLLVGIGGGAPGEHDIRLGDVVVGIPRGSRGAVIQYDFGKTIQNGEIVMTGSLNRPPDVLLTAVSILKSDHTLYGNRLHNSIEEMIARFPLLRKNFSCPGFQHDTLYEADHDHASDHASCEKCSRAREVRREPRSSPDPVVHYGPIASGNQVMKHGPTRDRLRRDHEVLCFEMEAAGLMDGFQCLVIRGISDYSDSHKNKHWQGYAAAAAAAEYAKEL
ncbi:hypothetical protein BO71DRAFT_484276 [Aspergillus ellipticus CBS 707.79]|uniref:DUF7580 domain-containing protein n=1 Tax=Aspergillus ellipticus CBS 707.79 TaxID=1448320 RepID=A0A319D905_9EURO|nr:hypothetical protein BO71DRAFT_484276 [Aspergillus ellipticus CBS 707.79]